MNKERLKGIGIGVVISSMIFIGTNSIIAQSINKKITVAFNSINIMANGNKVNADNILYNGTTYVPLRAVSEILGKKVSWNGNTNTASISDKGINNTDESISNVNHYTNVRFGFSVDYPKSWGVREESDNGDGKILYEDNGVEVLAYGTNMLESNFQGYLANYYEGWEIEKQVAVSGATQAFKLNYYGEESYQTAVMAEKDGVVYVFRIISKFIDPDYSGKQKETIIDAAEKAEATFKVLE